MSALPSDLAAPAAAGPVGALDPASTARAESAVKGLSKALEGAAHFDRAAVAARAEDAFAVSRSAKAKLKDLRDNPRGLSTIEKDAEVDAFLRERFKSGMTLAQLRAACVARFGENRSPSEGRIGVYRQRLREAWRTKRTRL